MSNSDVGSASVPCPACGNRASAVKDSRESPAGRRRRRECTGCSHRFTTSETLIGEEIDPQTLSYFERLNVADRLMVRRLIERLAVGILAEPPIG